MNNFPTSIARIIKKCGALSLLLFFLSSSVFSQNLVVPEAEATIVQSKLMMGLSIGYDLPSENFNYSHLDYSGGLSAGLFGEFYLKKNIGLGLDYDYLTSTPVTSISSNLNYLTGLSAVSVENRNVVRHFLGLGPSFRFSTMGDRLVLSLGLRGGISLFGGGDIVATAIDPTTSAKDYHLIHGGFNDQSLAAKAKLRIDYFLTSNLGVHLNLYHLRHFSVHVDRVIDIENLGYQGFYYGATDFDVVGGAYAVSDRDALLIQKDHCANFNSFGAQLGITYRMGGAMVEKKEKKQKIKEDPIPYTSQILIVEVKDGPSGQLIPEADVVLLDASRNIVSTGTTNTYGVVEFRDFPVADYRIEGQVYEIKTSIAEIKADELTGGTLRKRLLYEDLRFILKGVAVNKRSRSAEPNVVVNLKNTSTRKVTQDNTNGKGQFEFQLDPNSSYEVVGVKENRLSDIDRASTVGLTRSTTLFVELQLGLDDFDCGRGTVLDIKYAYDSADLLPESRFELDRLVRYMNDHRSSRIQMEAHTDSRGPSDYNLSLSIRRAQSAVNYIASKGITRSRITSQGFGESRLLNNCSDGVNCSEDQHKINRRTEAKLICR